MSHLDMSDAEISELHARYTAAVQNSLLGRLSQKDIAIVKLWDDAFQIRRMAAAEYLARDINETREDLRRK